MVVGLKLEIPTATQNVELEEKRDKRTRYIETGNFHAQFSSVVQSSLTLCNPMDCSMPRLPVHHQLLEFTQTYVHWVSDAIQPSHPCCSPLLLPSIFASNRVFSNESVLHIRWPKYFSFSSSPFNGCSGLISFRMDWLRVQGTVKSLLQHHNTRASILWHELSL